MKGIYITQAFQNEPATVTDHGFTLSSEKNTPNKWIEFTFDKFLGDNDEPVIVRANLWITDNTIDFVLEKLAALGWHGKDICELDPHDPVAFDFMGKRARITGEIETYKGKPRAIVKFINDIDSEPMKEMDKKDIKILNDRLRGKIAAFRSRAGSPSAAPSKIKTKEVETQKDIAEFTADRK